MGVGTLIEWTTPIVFSPSKIESRESRGLRKFLLFFSGEQLALIVAVGIVSGLVDSQLITLQFAIVGRIHSVVLLNDYLDYVTGGPIFGDILQNWYEYGGVLAAFLVRRPGAGTLALTINGICQVFVYGNHDPHLLYGVPGLGADLAFAAFRYRRYDLPAVALAGAACGAFWYPIVWVTHGIYLYPLSFIIPDLGFRVLGSAIGNGLFGGALGIAMLRLGGEGRDVIQPSVEVVQGITRQALVTGVALIVVGALIAILTYASPLVAGFFLSVGPKIPAGLAREEEYNPGFVIGAVIIYLVITFLSFVQLLKRGDRREDRR